MYGVKITPFRSYFNSRLGVKRTLLTFDPKFGVKLGVKVTPKKGYPVLKIFTPFLES